MKYLLIDQYFITHFVIYVQLVQLFADNGYE